MIELNDIYEGLNHGEFFLEYQPIILLNSGWCLGAEALIRWRRPAGVVMPIDFIPLVENTPVSGLITYWVIEKVAEELIGWLEINDDACVSINVPPEILGRGGLEYAARKSGLRRLTRQLVLEVTERGVPDRLGLDALNIMTHVAGVRIALDDVTLSGVNLAVLSRCSFDFIKLERSLVGQIDGSPRPEWLDGLSALLRSTPLQVIAEGVETEEQVETLKAVGVQMAQGYHFSLPLPAEGFKAFYAASRPSTTKPAQGAVPVVVSPPPADRPG